MVRLADLHPEEAESMRTSIPSMAERHSYERAPWIAPPPLAKCKIALLTSSGIHLRTDPAFRPMERGFRTIPADVNFGDLAQSHVSANFDRSAFQQDPNVVFPLERLRELANAGVIGAIADRHYAFVGARVDICDLEDVALEIGRLMKEEGVDAAILGPV